MPIIAMLIICTTTTTRMLLSGCKNESVTMAVLPSLKDVGSTLDTQINRRQRTERIVWCARAPSVRFLRQKHIIRAAGVPMPNNGNVLARHTHTHARARGL